MQEQTPWGKRYTSKATFGTCSQERASFSPHCLRSEGAAKKEGRVSSLYSFCLASPVHGWPEMCAVRRGALWSVCLAEGLFTPIQ